MSTTPNNMHEGETPEAAPDQDTAPKGASPKGAHQDESPEGGAPQDNDAGGPPTPIDEPVGPTAAELDALEKELAADEAAAPDDDAAPSEAPQPEAKPQRPPLATELQSRVDELQGQLLRAHAEVDNIRKRSERMVGDAHKYAVANFAKDLLSVPDNLKRAMDAVPEEARSGDGLVAKLLEGVSAVDRELGNAFEKHGLAKLEPMNVPFDPNFHEAVYEVPGSGQPAGTVVQLLQPGYTLHGRLVRAAMVGVSKGDGSPPEHKVDTTA